MSGPNPTATSETPAENGLLILVPRPPDAVLVIDLAGGPLLCPNDFPSSALSS